MRIGNLHQFTEHHRYYTFRDFSLSAVERKMLGLIYQPMIGAFAAGLYQQLYQHVAEDRLGYSPLEPQRKLLLGLGLDINERGRQELVDQASRLEAVGLLQVSRLGVPDNDDVVYEYELIRPLSPDEFFRNPHLTLLLRDKIGKFAVIALRESFYEKEADELAGAELMRENITVPFYELFRLNTQTVDVELEQALTEVAPSRQAPAARSVPETAGIRYGDIIMRFPRNSSNRRFVERLRGDEEQLAQLNYVAYKYGLTVVDLCRLLDEDGLFDARGELVFDELQLRANQLFRQDRKREGERQRLLGRSGGEDGAQTAVHQPAGSGTSDEMPDEVAVQAEFYMDVPAQLAGRCDIHQYNMLMRNEPHTRFIARFFPGAVPEWIMRVFEVIDLSYRLPGSVINVLIHYVFGMNDAQRVTKTYIDAVASNMLVKRIDTFEKAVSYVREQVRLEADKESRREGAAAAKTGTVRGAAAGGGSRGRRGKPAISIMQDSPGTGVTPEKLEELRKLARKLDGKA